MNTKKQVMVFAMGAAVLLTMATSVIVGAHYWEMLSGVWLIAILGLLLPDWVAYWATYWYARAGQDQRVKVTAMVVAALMAFTMLLNAGAVMAISWDRQQKDMHTQAQDQARIAAASSRASDIQRLKAAGFSDRAIRDYLRSENEREKQKALASNSNADTQTYKAQTPEPVRRYMAFWVYILPFLIGLIGKFAIVAAIALPGGAEFGQRRDEWPTEITRPGGKV